MSEQIVYVLITADYELFLGRNFLGSEEVLFAPTRRMIGVCEGLQVPITFFADVCSVWAYRDYGLDDYALKFEGQMCQAVRSGHDVQLHIHPHWLGCTYENGEWRISTERMYLSELGFGDGEQQAPAVIKRGVDYLNGLLRQEKPGYNCLAFRAAGLALQPEEESLIGALLNNGIRIDSSVAKGLRLSMDTIEIDYTRTPRAANWLMSQETGMSSPADQGLFEIPIATFKSGAPTRLGFLWRRLRSVSMRRGSGISRSERQTRWANIRTMLAYNLRYLYTNPWFSLSCDTKGYNLKMLLDGFDDYIDRHSESRAIFVSMINHPKLMFDPQFELLGGFVEGVRRRYGERVRFVTCGEVVGKLDGAEAT